LLLLIGLLCGNNPFLLLAYATSGWFFDFLESLLQTIMFCVLSLFWLIMIDKLRKEETTVAFHWTHIPKLLIVTVYGILNLVLFAWVSIRDQSDPVYGTSVTGIQVLFYFVAILWTGIILWVIILISITVPVVKRQPYLYTRFLFFAIPTGLVCISFLCSILAGTIGPLSQTTLSFMYFLSLSNVYVYFLVWAYWPARNPFVASNPTEGTPLTF